MILAEATGTNDADVQIAVFGMWQSIVVALVTGGLGALVTWLTTRSTNKKIAATNEELATVKDHTEKVHESINNRPTSVSDRLDDMKNLFSDKLGAVTTEIATLRSTDEGTRAKLDAVSNRMELHIEQTEPLLPMLMELHQEYVPKARRKP